MMSVSELLGAEASRKRDAAEMEGGRELVSVETDDGTKHFCACWFAARRASKACDVRSCYRGDVSWSGQAARTL